MQGANSELGRKSKHRERASKEQPDRPDNDNALIMGFERAYNYALTFTVSTRLLVSSLLLWRRGIVEVFNFAIPLPHFLLSFSSLPLSLFSFFLHNLFAEEPR